MATARAARTDTAISFAVFVGVLIVYVFTLCPTIYPGETDPAGAPLGESLRAVTSATHTSFIKSVEYPVWQFVARLFMSVSPNKAWALNLLSAIFGAAAIGLLYRVFSRFGHTRTHEELVRFRGQPWLPQFVALAAALLVAFSQTFWRASITAGTHTLNALFIVLVTHWLLCYRETRKKRYFMLYGIIYAVGIVNFPTMLLLLPVFLVLSILWCRDAYADWIMLGITIFIAAILFAIFLFSGPARFASGLPVYFLKPMPITRPMFDYVKWYWSQVRPVLPLGGLYVALYWLVWFLLPTVPPVAYLAFSKAQRGGEMGRASTITDGIFRVLAFLYTIFGVMILLDLVLGPYAMGRLTGFVVVYLVVGGWVCYMLGYWAILFTGKPSLGGGGSPTAAGPSGQLRPAAARYSKGGYAVVVAVCLLLPVASIVKHVLVDESSLAGFTLAEDFAHDTLLSAASTADQEQADGETPARTLLLVVDNWGELLRYVREYRLPSATAERITIADVNAAEGYDGLYVDKYAYLKELLVGQPVRPELDPALTPGLTDIEAALRYVGLGVQAKRQPAPTICITSDYYRFNAESDEVAYSYEAIPRGLVYFLSSRGDYWSLPATHVARGRELWGTLSIADVEPKPIDEWPPAAQGMMARASKLANDFGVYCHKYADRDDAIDFYKLSLRFYDLNYAALRNLRIAGADVDFDLDEQIGAAVADFDTRLVSHVEQDLGPAPDPARAERYTKFRAAFDLMGSYGLVRDVSVVDDLYDNYMGGTDTPRSFGFRYAIISLKVLLNPAGDKDLAERGALLYQAAIQTEASSLGRLVQSLMDFQAAEPYYEGKDRAGINYYMALIYTNLGDAANAEQACKKAIEYAPDWVDPKNRLADLYAFTDRRSEAIQIIKDNVSQHPPADRTALLQALRRLQAYYGAEGREEFVAFIEQYAEAHPDDALDWRLYLLDMAQGEGDYERAEQIADELARAYGNPVAVRLRMGLILFNQQRYQDVLALEDLPTDDSVEPGDRITWLRIRGQAFLYEGQPVQAYRDLKRAFEFADRSMQEQSGRTSPEVYADLLHLVSYSAVLAFEQTGDQETGRDALRHAATYRRMVSQLASGGQPQQRERLLLMAAAYYGWTRYKIEGDLQPARAMIEPAFYAFSSSPTVKLFFGAVLIEQGEVERGLALVKQVPGVTMNRYEKAEAERILAEHGVTIDEASEEPAAPEEPPAAPESVEVIEEGGGATEPADVEGTGPETETGETTPDVEPETPPED